MLKSILFFLAFISPCLCSAQKLFHKKVKLYKSELLKEDYYVLKKNKYIKHGEYRSYYKNQVVKKSGNYENNKKIGDWKLFDPDCQLIKITTFEKGRKTSEKKVGIWYEYFENRQVRKGFDYDKNEAIETLIDIPVRYPAIAREHEISGKVVIGVNLDKDCQLSKIWIKTSLHKECDEEALSAIKKMIDFTIKYTPKDCGKIKKEYEIDFVLE